MHGSVQVAVDLGAAPGAWTELLAATGAETVFAVDPADLSEQCLALANVQHVRKRSGDAVADIREGLRGRGVDIIVCDMNVLPQVCAPCIAPLLPLLAPGGYVILTCKFAGNGRERCAQPPWLQLLSYQCLQASVQACPDCMHLSHSVYDRSYVLAATTLLNKTRNALPSHAILLSLQHYAPPGPGQQAVGRSAECHDQWACGVRGRCSEVRQAASDAVDVLFCQPTVW